MIVVTGATGQFGRLVIERLAARVPAAELGLSVRDPEKATEYAQRGIRVVQGDFAEPATLMQAFEGAEQVLIVSANVIGDEAVRLHGHAFRAAKDAGVKRILYTSHQGANPASKVAFGRTHAASEALLEQTGVPFVSLRNGFYQESALFQLGGMKETGRLALPADGPVSWTSRKDLAEAAVAVLLNPSVFDGISPPLTAGKAIDFAQVARLASEILGWEVTRVVVEDQEYRAAQMARGLPEHVVELLASLFAATRAGEFDVVTTTLERVLGRRPTVMEETLKAYLA